MPYTNRGSPKITIFKEIIRIISKKTYYYERFFRYSITLKTFATKRLKVFASINYFISGTNSRRYFWRQLPCLSSFKKIHTRNTVFVLNN